MAGPTQRAGRGPWQRNLPPLPVLSSFSPRATVHCPRPGRLVLGQCTPVRRAVSPPTCSPAPALLDVETLTDLRGASGAPEPRSPSHAPPAPTHVIASVSPPTPQTLPPPSRRDLRLKAQRLRTVVELIAPRARRAPAAASVAAAAASAVVVYQGSRETPTTQG